MAAYRMEFKRHGDKLQDLQGKWSDVQYEIILLAVEIFGKGIVQLDCGWQPNELSKNIGEAHAQYEASARAEQDALAELCALEVNAEELSIQSISESKQHLQVTH